MEKDYMIGYQEHDLDKLTMVSYHKVMPVFGNRLIAKTYNVDGVYEGYQYGMYSAINKSSNPYEGWESDIIKYWMNTNKNLTLLHVAYDAKHNLVKKDLRVSFLDVPNLSKYYPNLEKISDVDFVLKIGTSEVLNFQFYVNGNISIEFIALNTDKKRVDILDQCLNCDLITEKQKQYIKTVAKNNLFSIKFGWKNNKLVLKSYVRDVNNWEGA